MSGSFLLILIGSMALIARACLTVDLAVIAGRVGAWRQRSPAVEQAGFNAAARPAMAERAAGLSRAESLAMTISRHDHSPRSFAEQGLGVGGHTAGNDPATPAPLRGRAASSGQRARQRMALSHVRRNQA
jgi:hypothetical protein